MESLITLSIPDEWAGKRIDVALSGLLPNISRSQLQHWIRCDRIKVNQANVKPKDKVKGGESVEISPLIETQHLFEPEPMDLEIVYEDDELLVINKPVGLVVHPAAGNWTGTLLNGLLNYHEQFKHLPRAGIVHRLDKNTSGLMVVAKTSAASFHLVKQLQARTVSREYFAIINGTMTGGGCIDAAIGRHPRDRKKMTVRADGKTAISHYRIIKKFTGNTSVKVNLETGRTHQIRVHMAHINHPVVGDSVYQTRAKWPANCSAELREALQQFPRQALHARKLALIHPAQDQRMEWEIDLPQDITDLITVLENNENSNLDCP